MFREFRRGNLNLTKGHQKCVRRRAVLSLQMNEKCRAEAERWVDEAFDACFADTAPVGFFSSQNAIARLTLAIPSSSRRFIRHRIDYYMVSRILPSSYSSGLPCPESRKRLSNLIPHHVLVVHRQLTKVNVQLIQHELAAYDDPYRPDFVPEFERLSRN